jgi:hypothetical protein
MSRRYAAMPVLRHERMLPLAFPRYRPRMTGTVITSGVVVCPVCGEYATASFRWFRGDDGLRIPEIGSFDCLSGCTLRDDPPRPGVGSQHDDEA